MRAMDEATKAAWAEWQRQINHCHFCGTHSYQGGTKVYLDLDDGDLHFWCGDKATCEAHRRRRAFRLIRGGEQQSEPLRAA